MRVLFRSADVDRHHRHAARVLAQAGFGDHCQQAGLRLQQTAGAAASTFGKELDRIAAANQRRDIRAEYRSVDRVAGKAAAQIARTSAAHQPAYWPELEIYTSSYMLRPYAGAIMLR